MQVHASRGAAGRTRRSEAALTWYRLAEHLLHCHDGAVRVGAIRHAVGLLIPVLQEEARLATLEARHTPILLQEPTAGRSASRTMSTSGWPAPATVVLVAAAPGREGVREAVWHGARDGISSGVPPRSHGLRCLVVIPPVLIAIPLAVIIIIVVVSLPDIHVLATVTSGFPEFAVLAAPLLRG